MKHLRRVLVVALGLVLAIGRAGHADELAPELQTHELRQKAIAELRLLVNGLGEPDRRHLVGLYLAFDESQGDPSAMAACDDDGDYVVVVSDALLGLAALVARAQSYDEANGTHALEDYAVFLAHGQIAGRRLLPPPAGFFGRGLPGTILESRLREALSFVIARELAHLRARDLACSHPTATHEHGDDTWTAAEQEAALATAANVYRAPAAARDGEAALRANAAGRSAHGALGWLRFFARYEAERGPLGFVPTYVRQHPDAAGRAAVVAAAVKDLTP